MDKCVQLVQSNTRELFDQISTVVIDCDGVLWNGSTPTQNAINTISLFKKLNKKVLFVTNNSTKSLRGYMVKFKELGFDVNEDEIFTPSVCAAKYLVEKNFKDSVYMIGSKGIAEELNNAGISHCGFGCDNLPDNEKNENFDISEWLKDHLDLKDNVGAVVMGFDPYVSFPKYTKAASYLRMNPSCHFIITNEDLGCPVNENVLLPGTGSLISPVIRATGREPINLGKPYEYMFKTIQATHNIDPSTTVMIGDKLSTDILFGVNNKFKASILVLSGVTQLPDVEKCISSNSLADQKMVPTYYIDCIGDIGKVLQSYSQIENSNVE